MILEFYLSFTKFAVFKLFDLKHRGILWIFGAEDEDRLAPFEDDKAKMRKFNKFKA